MRVFLIFEDAQSPSRSVEAHYFCGFGDTTVSSSTCSPDGFTPYLCFFKRLNIGVAGGRRLGVHVLSHVIPHREHILLGSLRQFDGTLVGIHERNTVIVAG